MRVRVKNRASITSAALQKRLLVRQEFGRVI